MSNEGHEHVVKLFVRADPKVGAEGIKATVVEQLTALEREGIVDRVECIAWGNTFRPDGPLQGTDYHDRIRDSIETFERWAAANGASLETTFRRETVSCTLTDETYEVISLPTVCLAQYRDGALRGVYPCHDGKRFCRVTDFLAEVDAGDVPVPAD